MRRMSITTTIEFEGNDCFQPRNRLVSVKDLSERFGSRRQVNTFLSGREGRAPSTRQGMPIKSSSAVNARVARQ
jgi:hypothetical protein